MTEGTAEMAKKGTARSAKGCSNLYDTHIANSIVAAKMIAFRVKDMFFFST